MVLFFFETSEAPLLLSLSFDGGAIMSSSLVLEQTRSHGFSLPLLKTDEHPRFPLFRMAEERRDFAIYGNVE